MNTAYFVRRPRTAEDLRALHPPDTERPYEIVSQITLTAIEYGNFTTDMLADRQFIEDASALCSAGEVMRCMLVTQRGRADGVLVVPEDGAFVKWAAYIPHVPEG